MNRVFAILVSTIVAACPLWAQTKIEQIAARVNGEIILKSEIDRELGLRRTEMLQQRVDPDTIERELAEQSKTVLRDLIDNSLLVQVAKEGGLNADLDVANAMEELRVKEKFATLEDLESAIRKDYGDVEEFKNGIRTRYMTQQVINYEVYRRIVITTDEMRKYYDEHQKEFDKPAGVRIAEIAILVDRRLPDQVATQRKKIEEALEALKKGDDFAEVARKYSEVSTAENGGDVGFFAGDQVNENIAKAIEGLSKNQITGIVEFNDAFEIFKVTDKHDGGILSFELAQRSVENALMERVAPPKIREFLTRLREDGFVEVKEGFHDEGAIPKKAKSVATNP